MYGTVIVFRGGRVSQSALPRRFPQEHSALRVSTWGWRRQEKGERVNYISQRALQRQQLQEKSARHKDEEEDEKNREVAMKERAQRDRTT